jgi:integrase
MLHELGATPKPLEKVGQPREASASPECRVVATVVEAFELFLEHSQQDHDALTYGWYKDVLTSAAKAFGLLPVAGLRPYEVNLWLARSKKRLSDTTKNRRIGAVKAALNWCVEQKVISNNPIKDMKKPAADARDRILTSQEREIIFGAVRDECFRDFLTAMQETGCRPGEVARVAPENINLDAGVWIFPKHKTRKKTGVARVVYLTPAMVELSKRLLAESKGGPLFRNRDGNPWDRCSLYSRLKTIKKKFPKLAGVVSYTFRHSFATDALENGVPDATVAELLGHKGTQTLHRHYSKLSKKIEYLRNAVEQATGKGSNG